jgi:Tol biopolymer transport system component
MYRGFDATNDHSCASLGILDLSSGVVSNVFDPDEHEIAPQHPRFDADHDYISHTSFSPSDRRLGFFHCRMRRGQRMSVLMVLDLTDGSVCRLTPGLWASHYCWCDDETVFVFDADEHGRRCYRFRSFDGVDEQRIDRADMIGDGHPQASPDGHWIILDTYPDRFMQQALMLYDRRQDRVHGLMRMSIPYRFRHEDRCDFHPRWDRQGRRICIDSAHEGVRSLYGIDVNDFVNSA